MSCPFLVMSCCCRYELLLPITDSSVKYHRQSAGMTTNSISPVIQAKHSLQKPKHSPVKRSPRLTSTGVPPAPPQECRYKISSIAQMSPLVLQKEKTFAPSSSASASATATATATATCKAQIESCRGAAILPPHQPRPMAVLLAKLICSTLAGTSLAGRSF